MRFLNKTCRLAWKDFKAYFRSPMGYLMLSLFIFIVGFMFYQRLVFFMQQMMLSAQFGQHVDVSLNEVAVKPLYGTINLILLFMIPIITMRLIAEEKKTKTIELLYTSPINNWHIVLGKYSASLMFVAILLISTLMYPFILYLGGNPDCNYVFVLYIGMFLVSSLYLSIGLFWSSITENQIIASMLSFVSLLFLWIVNWLSSNGHNSILFSILSINKHFESFLSGMLDIADISYFLSAIFIFLYLTSISLNSRNWD